MPYLLALLLIGLIMFFLSNKDEIPETTIAQIEGARTGVVKNKIIRVDDIIDGEVICEETICAEPGYNGGYVTFTTAAERAQYRNWLHAQVKG